MLGHNFDHPNFVSHNCDFQAIWSWGWSLAWWGQALWHWAAQLTIAFVSRDRPPPDFVPQLIVLLAADIITQVTSWCWTVGVFFIGLSLLWLMWSHCCLHCIPTQTSNSPGISRRGCSLAFESVSIRCILYNRVQATTLQQLSTWLLCGTCLEWGDMGFLGWLAPSSSCQLCPGQPPGSGL